MSGEWPTCPRTASPSPASAEYWSSRPRWRRCRRNSSRSDASRSDGPAHGWRSTPAGRIGPMREVSISGEHIRLGQLLKLVGAIDAGADAKTLLAEGRVTVNDEPETRRGRQLSSGDRISVAGTDIRLATAS